jgi:uncharacterized protein (TIGR00296 family)
MYQPKTIYSKVALETIMNFLKGITLELPKDDIPETLIETRRGCFVSLHKTDGSLRGCIGTIEPVEENLFKEITRNAIAAAFRDSRFSPLTLEKMDEVEISVDILTVPEEIFDLDDLRAVLLPSIPSIDTVEKQINIVKKKAGLNKFKNHQLKFYRFTSNRYH